MRYVSLGRDCFWSNLIAQLNEKNNVSAIDYMQTSLLALGGIYYFNNNRKIDLNIHDKVAHFIYSLIPRIILEYIFFRKCIFLQFNDDNIISLSTFNYYKIFKLKLFPVFIYHNSAKYRSFSINNINNIKKLKTTSNYTNNPADIYVYADNVKNNILTRFFIKLIYNLIYNKISKTSKLLILSKYKFEDFKNVHFIQIDIGKCAITPDGILYATQDIYDRLCDIFQHKFKLINIESESSILKYFK